MAGNELFSSRSVSITPHIARFREVSYQIANIGSVRVLQNRKHHPVAIALSVVAVGAFLFGYNAPDAARSEYAYYVTTFALAAAIAWQVLWPRIEYVLVLKTSSGDVQAYTTTSREHILEVKHAIEDAFARRT